MKSSRYVGFRLRCPILVGSLVVASLAQAQTADREALTEPVHRVSEAIPSVTGDRIVPPTKPKAMPVAPSEDAATEETKVASRASAAPVQKGATAESAAALCEAEITLQTAVSDAHKALKHIRENVQDYTCLLVKREKVGGEVHDTEYIEAKIRNRRVENGQTVVPFSIYMRFMKPSDYRGREVIWVEGKDNNYMRVHEGGTRGRFLPSVWLPPTGKMAMQTNRYPIWEVGIENLTSRLIERSNADRSINACRVTYRSGAKIDGRPCKYLEVKRPVPKTGDDLNHGMNVFIAQVFIDEEWNIPIRYAAYDWPRGEGERPEVVEEYTYQNIKLNVGLTDRDFDDKNPEYNF